MAFLVETFTASNGTALSGKTADTGGTWTACGFGVSNGTITSNRFNSASGTQNLYNNQVAGSQNYTVTWSVIKSASGGSTFDGYLGVRFDSSTKNGYIAGLNGNSTFVDMYKLSNGTPSALTSQATSWFPNSGDTWNGQITVTKSGSTAVIQFFLQRAIDSQWMQTNGTFSASKVACLTYTDSSPIEPTSGGYVFMWLDPDSAIDNISATANPLASTILTSTQDASGVSLSVTPSGGSPNYTVVFHRGTAPDFTASGGTQISTGSYSGVATYSDTTGTAGTVYYYRAIITDAASSTLTPPTIGAIRKYPTLGVVFIGDSNIYGANTTTPGGATAPPAFGGVHLQAQVGPRDITVLNRGISGTTSTSWISGSANLIAAKAARTAQTTTVNAMILAIGTNDFVAPASKATYKANVQGIVTDWLAAYPNDYIFLSCPIYTSPDANNGGNFYAAAGVALISQYRAALSEIVAATASSKVFLGDNTAWEAFADHTSDWYATETFGSGSFIGQQFFLHANDLGAREWGILLVARLANIINRKDGGGINGSNILGMI